jgi:phosphate acyltransferase
VSSPRAVCNMVLQARKMAASNISERFKKNYSA